MTTTYSSETVFISAIALMTLVNFSDTSTSSTVVDHPSKYFGSEISAVGLPFMYSETPKLTEANQKEILIKFVTRLVENAKDPPQEAIDILNRHFWDLI